MRINRIVCFFIITLLFSSYAYACGDHPVMSTRKNDGTQIGLFISQQQIESTQKWSPQDGEPPLGISAAYRIIKEWAETEYIRYDEVKIKEISLKPYGCSLVSSRWYYVIDLNPIIEGNELWGSGNWVAVLMDGTIIGTRKY